MRGLLGFFWQEQKHDFWQPFVVEGLADVMLPNQGTNPRYADQVYLNSMDRKDTDEAVFASVSFDITDRLELTGGIRFFKAETTVDGFFGFGLGFNPGHAAWVRPGRPARRAGRPRERRFGRFFADLTSAGLATANGDARRRRTSGTHPARTSTASVEHDDHVGRVNLNYRWTDDVLLYATWSEGFRPGGINRNPFVGDYEPDFLTNWELGWKSEWGGSLQFNGALFFLRVGQPPACLPGRKRHHAGGQRAERRDHRRRGATIVGRDRQLPVVGRGRLLRH